MDQVAPKKKTEVVVSELDKLLEEDSGAGLENSYNRRYADSFYKDSSSIVTTT